MDPQPLARTMSPALLRALAPRSRSPSDLRTRLRSPGGPGAGPGPLQPRVAQFAINAPVPPTRHSTALPAGPGQGQPLQAFWGVQLPPSRLLWLKETPVFYTSNTHTHTYNPGGTRCSTNLGSSCASPARWDSGGELEHQLEMLSAGTDRSVRTLPKGRSLPLSSTPLLHCPPQPRRRGWPDTHLGVVEPQVKEVGAQE